MNLVTTVVLLSSVSSCVAFAGLPHASGRIGKASLLKEHRSDDAYDFTRDDKATVMTRRETLAKSLLVGASAVGIVASPENALAFPNKVSNQYDDRPKQRGSKPKGLGVAMRQGMAGEEYLGLKPCGAAPNCFCSTDSIEDSPDTNIPPFKWPTNQVSSREDAFQQLYEVVQAYQPGQSNIDGGGFEIETFDPKAGYMYVQFQSLKNGFIDDFELAAVGDEKDSNVVQVRSSSRLGYLDYAVNAKRINYIAKALRAKGWDATGVELETHGMYAEENNVKSFS